MNACIARLVLMWPVPAGWLLLQEVARLAGRKAFDYLVIESTGEWAAGPGACTPNGAGIRCHYWPAAPLHSCSASRRRLCLTAVCLVSCCCGPGCLSELHAECKAAFDKVPAVRPASRLHTGISEPMQVAETFTFQLHDHGHGGAADVRAAPDQQACDTGSCGPSLMDVARLDTCVTVVDAAAFFTNVESIEDLRDRWALVWAGLTWVGKALGCG